MELSAAGYPRPCAVSRSLHEALEHAHRTAHDVVDGRAALAGLEDVGDRVAVVGGGGRLRLALLPSGLLRATGLLGAGFRRASRCGRVGTRGRELGGELLARRFGIDLLRVLGPERT